MGKSKKSTLNENKVFVNLSLHHFDDSIVHISCINRNEVWF